MTHKIICVYVFVNSHELSQSTGHYHSNGGGTLHIVKRFQLQTVDGPIQIMI